VEEPPPVEEPPVEEPLPVLVPAELDPPEEPEDPELGAVDPLDEDPEPAEDADPEPLALVLEVAVVDDVVATVDEAFAAPVGTVSGGAPDVFAVADAPPPQPARLTASRRQAERAVSGPTTRAEIGAGGLTSSAAAYAFHSKGSR